MQALGVYRGLLDGHGLTEWLAYQQLAAESSVVAILRDGTPVVSANEGEIVGVVLDHTPFDTESGGQDSDAGSLTGPFLRLRGARRAAAG